MIGPAVDSLWSHSVSAQTTFSLFTVWKTFRPTADGSKLSVGSRMQISRKLVVFRRYKRLAMVTAYIAYFDIQSGAKPRMSDTLFALCPAFCPTCDWPSQRKLSCSLLPLVATTLQDLPRNGGVVNEDEWAEMGCRKLLQRWHCRGSMSKVWFHNSCRQTYQHYT